MLTVQTICCKLFCRKTDTFRHRLLFSCIDRCFCLRMEELNGRISTPLEPVFPPDVASFILIYIRIRDEGENWNFLCAAKFVCLCGKYYTEIFKRFIKLIFFSVFYFEYEQMFTNLIPGWEDKSLWKLNINLGQKFTNKKKTF